MGKKEPFRFLWEKLMIKQTDLRPTTKHILLTLAVFMDEKAVCFPSVALLSQRTSLSRYSIITHLEKANKAGWIETTIAGFNGQGWKRNKYKAIIPEKVVNEVDHVIDKAVNEVDYVMGKGGQPNEEGGEPNDIKVVNEVDHVIDKAVNEVDYVMGKGGQPNEEGGQPKLQKVVNEVDTNTTLNTTKNTILFSCNSDELQLSSLLYSLILERNPKYKKPDLQKWSKHIDLAIRIDKRTLEELEKVINWSQQNEFWQTNILSTRKLRKQFDQLYIKMRAENGKQSNTGKRSTKYAGIGKTISV